MLSAKAKATLAARLLLLAGLIPAAQAQDAAPPDSAIEEVVVTVERREQSLQDLAGTAMVIEGEELKMLGLQNINDLDGNIPGLSIANNAGNIEVFIRGIGSTNNTELGDPAAATHLNGVYVPRPSGFGAAFFDIQRVEVNIGPQGTLRGRNATSGSINIIPWAPGLGIRDFMLEATLGAQYGEWRFEGMGNVPVSENSAIRVAGFILRHDSYYKNANPLSASLGLSFPTSASEGVGVAEKVKDLGLRVSYLIKPSERLALTLSYDDLRQDGSGYTGTNYAALLGDGIEPAAVNDPREVLVRPITPQEDTRHYGFKGQLDYEADGFSVEYIGSYRDLLYDYRWAGAADTANYPDASVNYDDFSRVHSITSSESIIQELRFYGDELAGLPLRWNLGGFYFKEDQRTFLGSTGDNNTFYKGNEFNQRTEGESFSLYTDATWAMRDALRFTGGLRYTKDKKKRTGVNARYQRFLGLGGAQFSDNHGGGGARIGTEGFAFSGLSRSIINPDTDADGNITFQEIADFYLDGIASFGARDTGRELVALANRLYTQFPNGFTAGLDPAVFDGNGTPGAAAAARPACAEIIAALPTWQCPAAAGSLFNIPDEPALLGRASYLFLPSPAVIALQNGQLDNNFLDWRARVEYDVSEARLLYGMVATGHKSGGFNDNVPTIETPPPAAPGLVPPPARAVFDGTGVAPTYKEESVRLFELGSKNEFDLGTRLGSAVFNVSGFYYDYDDYQVTNLVSTGQIINFAGLAVGDSSEALADARDNIVSFTFNASDAEIYGVQFDGGLYLPSGWNVDYTLLWLGGAKIVNSRTVQDSRFEFSAQYGVLNGTPDAGNYVGGNPCLPNAGFAINAACNAVERSIEGHRLPRTPEVQLNASLSKAFSFESGTLDVIFSAGYRSSQYMTIFNGRVYNPDLSDGDKMRLVDRVSGYWTFDAGIGYTLGQGDKFRLEGYVNNITDVQNEQAIIITQRDNTRFFARPRTAGVRLRVRF